MPNFESPLAHASNEEIEEAVDSLKELPREKTQYNIKVPTELPGEKTKIVRLEDIRKPKEKEEDVMELSEEDLEEIPEEEIELTEADLEELPGEITQVTKRHEVMVPPEQKQTIEHAQEKDVVETFEIRGFEGLDVVGALEKKSVRIGNPEKRNEDNILADPETGLVGVLDGLGGEGNEGAGARASKAAELVIPGGYKLAKEELAKMDNSEVQNRLVDQQLAKMGNPNARKAVTEMVENFMTTDPDMAREALALVESIRSANEAVKESGGKTTALVSKIHTTPSGERYALVANIGDCLAMKQRANGELVPITEEDSAFNALSRAGELTPELAEEMKKNPDKVFDIPLSLPLVEAFGGDADTLKAMEFLQNLIKSKSPEDMSEREKKMAEGYHDFVKKFTYNKLKLAMTASLGSEAFEPSLTIRKLAPGESLILETDGLVDVQEDPETSELDTRQILLDMSGERMQTFFDPEGNVDLEKLHSNVMSLPLKTRVENMRKAASSRKNVKDDDKAIIALA